MGQVEGEPSRGLDRSLPSGFAQGVVRSLHGDERPFSLRRLTDTEDPEALTKIIVRLSRKLPMDPPASTAEELFSRLPDDGEPQDTELTPEEMHEALRLGAEDEKRAAIEWGEFEIPYDKSIPQN